MMPGALMLAKAYSLVLDCNFHSILLDDLQHTGSYLPLKLPDDPLMPSGFDIVVCPKDSA